MGDHKVFDKEILEFKPPSFRWLSRENWHFTIVFLGYQKLSSVGQIQKSMEKSVQGALRFEFEKIILGPPGLAPRMVWLLVNQKTNDIFAELKNRLEKNLEENGILFKKENRPAFTHLTLARFEPVSFRNLPPINRKVNFSFEAREIYLMKSTLKRSGAEYEKLVQIDF